MSNQVTLEQSRGIHKRVVGGRTKYEKVNTSKPHKGKGYLAKAIANRDRRRTDMANTISNARNSSPGAYKLPGSMKLS